MGTVKQEGRLFIFGVAVLVALALAPGVASADGIDGGNVHLKLGHGLTKALKQEGVRLMGIKPAKAGKAGVTFPVSSGLLDPKFGSGYLFLEGGFRLRAGKRAVTLRRLVLNTAKRSLSGKVDGATITVAKLPPQRASRDGFALDITLKLLKLTAKAAAALNRKLALDGIFKAGRSIGSAGAIARFEWLTVTGGEMVFTIDEGFRQKLASVEAFVNASGSATLRNTAPIVVAMPLEGGQVAPDGSVGALLSQGGLSFAQHDKPFDHTIAFLDTNLGLESHLVTGDANYNPNPQQVPFSSPFATLPSANTAGGDPDTGVVGSPPIRAVLHPNFAAVLNEVLGAPKGKPDLFTAGEFIGAFAFEAQTR